jgi:hypothetical protein
MDKQQIINQIESYCDDRFKYFLITAYKSLEILTIEDLRKKNCFIFLEISFNRPKKGYENTYSYQWEILFDKDSPDAPKNIMPFFNLEEAKKMAEKILSENDEWIQYNLDFIKEYNLNTLEKQEEDLKKEFIERAKSQVINLENDLEKAKKELKSLME